MNSNRNPVQSALAALAAMSVLAQFAQAEATTSQPSPAPHPTGTSTMRLEDVLADMVGAFPADAIAARPICEVCAIPQDIAQRCGMYAAGFDPHGITGRTVALLAAVLANLREMQDACDTTGRAQVAVAESHITAAVTAVHAALRTGSTQQTAKPANSSL